MGDTSRDPIDHHRTTEPRAGESMKSGAKTRALLLFGAGVVAFVVCLASFAERQVGVGVGAAAVALLASGAGFAWLGMESRRIRQVQREWKVSHGAGTQ
ncbi:MAG TPA: LapA family protein [Mycobacterium sp.]|uniref:LapA family protein n=1 Tax=Mycobacterium sp. TaxID=1785 RepID=UPI002CB3B64B|nr:LapA family protein [Mycobacterium sp.]HME76557.1 LapA family protein [Mycobacterium sp.]